MYNYVLGRLRDNLHLALCFSPVNAKFAVRPQKFPAVFSVNINWFLPWPEEALVDVSSNFLGKYDKLDASQQDRDRLYKMMGAMQAVVGDICGTYYTRMRKHVYVTPKSYLCLIDFYKALYEVKYNEVNILEKQVNQGLAKLADASEDVNKMKILLGKEKEVLAVEEKKTNELLS